MIINSICLFCHFQGIILVYDITTEDSFKHIAQWLQNIQDVSTVCVYIVLREQLTAESLMAHKHKRKHIKQHTYIHTYLYFIEF